MTDASRAVDVVSQLLSPERQSGYIQSIAGRYAEVREGYGQRTERRLTSLESARANALSLDFSAITKPLIKPGLSSYSTTRLMNSSLVSTGRLFCGPGDAWQVAGYLSRDRVGPPGFAIGRRR